MKVDDLVEKYIQLRDKKAVYKAEFDAKVEKIDEALTKVENVLLKHFIETGAESVKTASGTAYTTNRTSTKVSDWDSFLEYVKSNDAYHLLVRNCAKTAVEEFKTANNDLPPGIDWKSEVVVNIRRK